MPTTTETPFTVGRLLDTLRTYPPDAQVVTFAMSILDGDVEETRALYAEPGGTTVEDAIGTLEAEDADTIVRAAVVVVDVDGETHAQWHVPFITGGTDAQDNA